MSSGFITPTFFYIQSDSGIYSISLAPLDIVLRFLWRINGHYFPKNNGHHFPKIPLVETDSLKYPLGKGDFFWKKAIAGTHQVPFFFHCLPTISVTHLYFSLSLPFFVLYCSYSVSNVSCKWPKIASYWSSSYFLVLQLSTLLAQGLIFPSPICSNRNQMGMVIYWSHTNQSLAITAGHSMNQSACSPVLVTKGIVWHKIWLPRASRTLGKTNFLQGQAGHDPRHRYNHHLPRQDPYS